MMLLLGVCLTAIGTVVLAIPETGDLESFLFKRTTLYQDLHALADMNADEIKDSPHLDRILKKEAEMNGESFITTYQKVEMKEYIEETIDRDGFPVQIRNLMIHELSHQLLKATSAI